MPPEDTGDFSTLRRLLAERLKDVRLEAAETAEAGYDASISRVARRMGELSESVARSKARVEDRHADLVDLPRGRQKTLLANSSPMILLALAHNLMKESYAHRFDRTERSLAIARLAHDAARAAAETDLLSEGSAADLIGESLDYLGNALRINSDLAGAERALADAERHLESGTRDRHLRGFHLGVVGALRFTQGRAHEAEDLWRREAAIWRLVNDPHRLGAALIGRGLAASWTGDVFRAIELVREGAELIEDDRAAFIGLMTLAETFARDGDGFQAWKVLSTCDLIATTTDLGHGVLRRHRWVKGLAYRSNGELARAEQLIRGVRDELLANNEMLRAAVASLDLLVVLAAQGKRGEVIPLAEATYRLLSAEQLDEKALSAFLILRRAALAEELTEELAARVANFIVRRQHDREARYE